MAKGEYPIQLKIAKVIALCKRSEKCSPGNYRPISLLSCLNKIFEKLLYKRLVKFLEVNKILFNFQFGFRRLHSPTLALIEFPDNIRNILDEGNYAISIFIDLTKAFDKLIMKYCLTNWTGTVFEDIQIVSLDHTSVKENNIL